MPSTMSAPRARVSTTANVRFASPRVIARAWTMRAWASSIVDGMNQNSGWLTCHPRRFSTGATKHDEGPRDAAIDSEQIELFGSRGSYLCAESLGVCRRGSVHRLYELDVPVCEVSSNQWHVLFPPVGAVEGGFLLFEFFDGVAV